MKYANSSPRSLPGTTGKRRSRSVVPIGAPLHWQTKDTLEVVISDLVAVSPNTTLWEHWTKKNARSKRQGVIVQNALAPCLRPPLPLTVTMFRCAPRELDDDNLAGAFKKIRDSIAEWLGIDDRDPRVTWRVEQKKVPGKEAGTVIRIERRA